MALTVKISATERNLTTISAVKDAIGITDESLDAYLQRLIRAASDAIEKYCNRIFARQTYIETIKGADHPVIMVSQTPIINLVSVLCEGEPITDYDVDDAEVRTAVS